MFGNTALAVVLFSGILGLPFADTMRELFRRLSKMFTDVEVDIELVMRQSLTEMFSGITSPENAAILADSALRGSARNALGFDLSKRAGFGELLGYDVMNGKLWVDDTQVRSLYANKQWASPDQPGYFTLGLSEVE